MSVLHHLIIFDICEFYLINNIIIAGNISHKK